MDLWYEKLKLCLSACGKDVELRARFVFAYLSMSVLRSWWEEALSTGIIHRDHSFILHELKIELSNVYHLKAMIDTGLLIAMAFTDKNMPEDADDDYTKENNRYGLYDYIEQAKEVLSMRPDLVLLGEKIDDERKLCIMEKIAFQRLNNPTPFSGRSQTLNY